MDAQARSVQVPTGVLAFREGINGFRLTDRHHERLAGFCAIPDRVSLTDFTTHRAARLLGAADALLTSWGAPVVDEDVLDEAPHLKAIVHLAGSVRNLVTPACFERGLRLSSAAEVNETRCP